jgi:hypothetical protein
MAAQAKETGWAGGGCQCGALRYEVDLSQVQTLYCCHCRECQKQSSSGFGMSMVVPSAAFRLLEGDPQGWSRQAESGRKVEGFHCPLCGSRVFHSSSRGGGFTNLRAGSLDDTSRLRPVGHLWTDSKQDWVILPPDSLCYARQPDSLDALVARYQAQCAGGKDSAG